MKTDELVSLIKSYDQADKQEAQDNSSAASCSSTHVVLAALLPDEVGSSTPAVSSPNSESSCRADFQIHDFTPTPTEVCVDNICCTTACREKVSGYKEQADSLVMQLQLSKSDLYQVKKKVNGYKDMVEAQKRDIQKLHNDLSQERCRHLHFKELSEKLTAELDSLKSTFENTDFNFKKFDVSSEKVENMINKQLQFSKKEVRNKGLGYVCIPPPYNHNYTSIPITEEEIANMPNMVYGRPSDVKVEPVKTTKVKISKPKRNETKATEPTSAPVFVKSEDISKQTETLSFEKNAEVDKYFQVLNPNKPTEPVAPSDSKCESPEATDSEKLESADSCESSCESSGAANSTAEDSSEPLQNESNSSGSAESSSETLTEPTTFETETTRSVLEFNCVNVTNASTSCADEVIIEDWDEGDDVVCQKGDDVCSKTSNLSADAPPYVRKAVSEPALRGPSNKYVPPKPTVRNENIQTNECANCCKQGHRKQSTKFEKSANKSSNKFYNSNSSSVGSNGSGYAPYVKKQTCYNCGIPGHIARNCTHRPYVSYYTQHQKVTSRDRSYSKPMRVEKPKAMMNKHPQVKPSDGDWNAAKAKGKRALKSKQVLKNKKVEKQTVLPKASKKLEKPKQVWKAKHKAATSPIPETKGDMCFREVSYVDASGIPRTTMAWVPMSY